MVNPTVSHTKVSHARSSILSVHVLKNPDEDEFEIQFDPKTLPQTLIAPGGVPGKTYQVPLAAVSGGTPATSAPITVVIFVSDSTITVGTGNPPKTGYQVGILICAANGALQVGPYWGLVGKVGGAKLSFSVIFSKNPVLSGSAVVTASNPTAGNKITLDASFTGLYSGASGSLSIVNPST